MFYILGILVVVGVFFFLSRKKQGSVPFPAATKVSVFAPEVKITVSGGKAEPRKPAIVDFSTLDGVEYKQFKVAGRGASGRKKTKEYEATSADSAEEMARQDGLTPETTQEVPPPSASDSQKQYARDLGITFSESISFKHLSYLISATVDDPAPEYQMHLAEKLDIQFDRLIFKSDSYVYRSIRDSLGGAESERYAFEVAKCYTYSILRYLQQGTWESPAQSCIDEAWVDSIAQKAAADKRVLKSIMRQTHYKNLRLLTFNGSESKDTIAFSSVKALCQA